MEEWSSQLHRAGRPRLAGILAHHGAQPFGAYGTGLRANLAPGRAEPAVLAALDEELARVGCTSAERAAALAELEHSGTLVTATHLTPTDGPTFLAVHLSASAGLPADRPYLVGAYSAVPFANPAWSGALSYGAGTPLEAVVEPGASLFSGLARDQAQRGRDSPDRRLSLVPGRLRDALVYRARLPERTSEVVSALRPALREIFAPAPRGGSYTGWALRANRLLCERVLDRAPVLVFDLNEVIAGALRRVLGAGEHPLHRLLFAPEVRGPVLAALGPDTPLFWTGMQVGQRDRLVPLVAEGGELCGGGLRLPLEPATVVDGLSVGRLCPGLLLTFGLLVLVDGLRCIGSFEQVEYLGRWREALLSVGWPSSEALARVETDLLATGRCLDAAGEPVYPLDLVLGREWRPDLQAPLASWIAPLLPRLLRG